MPLKLKLVDLNSTPLRNDTCRKRTKPIDWSLCILCQEDSNDDLVDPSQNKRIKKVEGVKKVEGFETLDRNLKKFELLGKPVCDVPVNVLDAGEGIKANLEQNKAVYHKKCFQKCSDSKLKKAKEAHDENLPPCTPSPVYSTRRSVGVTPTESGQPRCLVCGKEGVIRNSPLNRVLEKGSRTLSSHAVIKSDTKVLVGLQQPEVWCHKVCYSAYTYHYEADGKHTRASSAEVHEDCLKKVVQHIKAVKTNTDESPVFNMADLARMYSSELEENGIATPAHSSRLKSRILDECPYLEATGTAGQKSLVMFRKDLDVVVRENSSNTQSGKSAIEQAAAEVREEIFSHVHTGFGDMTCGETCVPKSLKTLVKMTIDGTPYDENAPPDPVILTIAQLILFHTSKRRRNEHAHRRHDHQKESPTPVYIAAKIYGETRKRNLIDKFYKLGISISYDRLQDILKEKASRACRQYKEDGVVAPISMQLGAFTTGQVDNLDQDPSAMTAKNGFHGTVISLMQHGPEGLPRTTSTQSLGQKAMALPAGYIVVPPCLLDGKQAKCTTSAVSRVTLTSTNDPHAQELDWLESCRESTTIDTWPAFHSRQLNPGQHRTRAAVLPAFRDKSQSMSMMAHSMNKVKECTNFLNPTQIAVIEADQPLYALCKELQWLRPADFGEDKIFVMMGGLHIEMASLRVVGEWLDGSGWTSALVAAGITTPGRAEAMVTVNHVTRTRYAHQVTAAVLHQLKQEAYDQYSGDDPLSFQEWCEEMRKFPQFRFWDIAFNLELIVLQIVRALRVGNFRLFNEAISRIVPYFFGLDHQNYARWLPVHIRDNIALEQMHPSLWDQFTAGYFVADKTGRLFSKIALDHAHEQLNAMLKGDGGMVGLTEDPGEMLKWMLKAPEVAEMCSKFEGEVFNDDGHDDLHHFDTSFARNLFAKDKSSLLDFFRTAGNPFLNDGPELFNIDSRKCCDKKVIETVMTIETLGAEQYKKFCEERLQSRRVSIHFKISKNKLATFSDSPKTTTQDRSKAQLKSLKKDLNLFSHMWVAISNNRPSELDEFFAHENQLYPPALATLEGNMRPVTKSDLVDKCLGPLTTTSPVTAPPVDCKIIDGAALLYILKPGLSVDFADFSENVFRPFVIEESKNTPRVDVVLDVYVEDSLKASTREKRGDGPRLIVKPDTKVPGKEKEWTAFLRNAANKGELFDLLADSIASCDPSCKAELYVTKGDSVVTNFHLREDLTGIAPCNHEEADTRVFVHVADAVRRGATRVLIRASDADIVALACACFVQIPELVELWVHRPTSKKYRILPIHEITAALGPEKSRAIPAFHAFTGCDNVEGFYGIGKKNSLECT